MCKNTMLTGARVQMQRYIRFARTMQPKLTPHAQKVLVAEYRKLRQGDSVGAYHLQCMHCTVAQC